MKYSVLESRKKDASFIYELKKVSIQEYVTEIWGWDEKYQLAIFREDFKKINDFQIIKVLNKRIGFLQITETKSDIFINEIHLVSDYQCRGIGSSIIENIIRKATIKEKTVFVGCFKNNRRAKELYIKLGFQLNGETKTHFLFKYTL